MSLTGNLEDLPLLDIIQIVSFSKKTGYLTIRNEAGDAAAIVFRDGYVVCSFTWDSPPLDPRAAGLPPGKRDGLIRNRIAMALEQLIRLREGQFSFSLTEDTPAVIGARSVAGETLEQGINPQELLLELAKGIDEDRRDSSAALEASFAEPAYEAGAEPAEAAAGPAALIPGAAAPEAVPAPPGAAREEIQTVLLIDDEEDVRRLLAGRFVEGGYQVVEAEDTDEAVKKAGSLGRAGVPFVVVTDLGMPTSGGSSFHGGFEVVKRLWKMKLHPPVLMMTESLSAALQARAKQMGVGGFVFKPGLSKLDPEQFRADLRAFADKILSDILPKLAHTAVQQAAGGAPRPLANARSMLRGPSHETSRELAILSRHLEELRRALDPTQISTLIMKVAREFFERGVLFLIKSETMRGLGGFGLAPRGERLNLLARQITIPLGEPSLFLNVITVRKPWNGTLPDERWTRYLLGKVGRFKSGTVALFPLLAHREPIACLMGDNPETGTEFGRLEAFDVFINQAGVALENLFLQRKLLALQHKE